MALNVQKLLATFGMSAPYRTEDVPALFQERDLVLDGQLAGGAATQGEILDADVTDANRASGLLRVQTPSRAIVTGMALVIPGVSVADLETLAGALAIQFAVNGATYIFPAAPFIQVPAGSDGAASPEPSIYTPVRTVPIDMPVAFQGVTTDRVQLIADAAVTFPAVSNCQLYLHAAVIDASVEGGRKAIQDGSVAVGEQCGCTVKAG